MKREARNAVRVRRVGARENPHAALVHAVDDIAMGRENSPRGVRAESRQEGLPRLARPSLQIVRSCVFNPESGREFAFVRQCRDLVNGECRGLPDSLVAKRGDQPGRLCRIETFREHLPWIAVRSRSEPRLILVPRTSKQDAVEMLDRILPGCRCFERADRIRQMSHQLHSALAALVRDREVGIARESIVDLDVLQSQRGAPGDFRPGVASCADLRGIHREQCRKQLGSRSPPRREILSISLLPWSVRRRGKHLAQPRDSVGEVEWEPVFLDLPHVNVHVPQPGYGVLPGTRHDSRVCRNGCRGCDSLAADHEVAVRNRCSLRGIDHRAARQHDRLTPCGRGQQECQRRAAHARLYHAETTVPSVSATKTGSRTR